MTNGRTGMLIRCLRILHIRRVAMRPPTAPQLAQHFGVSLRTIRRDTQAIARAVRLARHYEDANFGQNPPLDIARRNVDNRSC